ncbi:MAG: LacI family DNA-binding transcriptional regulator [Clostridiales bacterium]
MKIKLVDIAKKMGISTAAVSMGINNKDGVSKETREKVLKVAEELGYKIHKKNVKNSTDTKRFIKLLRIKKHGLVVMETDFFAAVINGIEKQCKKIGYELLISNINLNKEDSKQLKNEYHSDIDGMIALCTELDELDLVTYSKIKCPLVILDSKSQYNIDTVLINNQKAVRQAVKYLCEKKHITIGYFKSSTRIYNFDSRFKSYCEAMTINGLTQNDKNIIKLEPTIQGAYRDMINYIEKNGKKNLASAYLADNDNIALGAMNALKEKGVNFPEDVSIVGIDDMSFCTIISPKLTTVRIYKEEMGKQSVKMLLDRINGDTECSKKVEIDTLLIERNSVKDMNN